MRSTQGAAEKKDWDMKYEAADANLRATERRANTLAAARGYDLEAEQDKRGGNAHGDFPSGGAALPNLSLIPVRCEPGYRQRADRRSAVGHPGGEPAKALQRLKPLWAAGLANGTGGARLPWWDCHTLPYFLLPVMQAVSKTG